jgi:hypothetical protein
MWRKICFQRDTRNRIQYGLDRRKGTCIILILNLIRLAKPGDTLRSNIDDGIEGQIMAEFLPLKDKVKNLVVSADNCAYGS